MHHRHFGILHTDILLVHLQVYLHNLIMNHDEKPLLRTWLDLGNTSILHVHSKG